MNNTFPAIGTMCLAVLLTSCSSVPLQSLIQLSRIDAEATDLSALRFAVRLPNALRPRPGGVNMEAIVKVGGEADQTTSFLLTEAHDPAELSAAPGAAAPGFSTYVYRLATADIERFAALRLAAFKKRREGRSTSIGVGIAAKEFCSVGPLPAGALLSTTYLLTSETRSYVTVTKDLDLSRDAAIKQQLARLASC